MFKYLFVISKLFSRQNLYRWLKSYIKSLENHNINVLNIGAGGEIGNIVNDLKKKNNVITIDIDPDRNPDIVMDATNLEFDSNSFDVVFIMEILEHIKEPQKAVDEIFRVLKDEGIVVFSTPFVFGIHDKPYDFFRYTRYGILEVFKKYKSIEIKERNDYLHTIIVLFSRLLLSEYKIDKVIGALFIILILITYPLIFIISKTIKSNNITTGYFCIARK